MPNADFFARLGLFVRRNFFDARLCAELQSELRSAGRIAAAVRDQGRTYVDRHERSGQLAEVSAPTAEMVKLRLLDLKPELEQHFHLSLAGCRPPQFLAYGPGDFFGVHRDTGQPGATPKPNERQVSVVIFLTTESPEPQEGLYGGGNLTFFGLLDDARAQSAGLPLVGQEGLLIAFRSGTLHGVTPVTHGERYTIVSWYS